MSTTAGNGTAAGSTEAVLHHAVRSALPLFGLDASVVWSARSQGGRTIWKATLTPPSPSAQTASALPPRRWSKVAEALQSLCEAALLVRGETSAAVEVLLPAIVEGDAVVGLADEDEALVQAALRLGRVAAAQGRAFALGPMSANERRLVHNALSELPGVRTQSEGEGIYRRLWVLPRG
jgi:hypothetical protein